MKDFFSMRKIVFALYLALSTIPQWLEINSNILTVCVSKFPNLFLMVETL